MFILWSSPPTQILPCDVYSSLNFSPRVQEETSWHWPCAVSSVKEGTGFTLTDSNANGIKRENSESSWGVSDSTEAVKCEDGHVLNFFSVMFLSLSFLLLNLLKYLSSFLFHSIAESLATVRSESGGRSPHMHGSKGVLKGWAWLQLSGPSLTFREASIRHWWLMTTLSSKEIRVGSGFKAIQMLNSA